MLKLVTPHSFEVFFSKFNYRAIASKARFAVSLRAEYMHD